MERRNLSSMTVEERISHKREQANARKRKQRSLAKDQRKKERSASILTAESPEVIEMIDALKGLRFGDMIEPLAFWERQYKQRFPYLYNIPRPGSTSADDAERGEHYRQISLAKFYSQDFYARQKAAVRRDRFNLKQTLEAKSLGITVFELQQRQRRDAWLKNQAAEYESVKTRVLERLAKRFL